MKNKIVFVLLIIGGCILYACKKDVSSGPPSISNVRAVDTTRRDSFFLRAVPGTMIVIQGNNMGGLQAVLFNDTSAYFNPVYATSTNIIVTIPASAQTKATNPGVPDVIKIITDHGTATFAFQLYLPPPVISSITFDNSGKLVYINGVNFQGIKKVVFPTANKDTALSYTVNKTYTQIAAVIPPGTALQDSLRVQATFGTGAFSYPPPMIINSVSNENGTAGTTITVNGTNFIGITQVVFPGGKLGTNLQVLSVNQLTVTVPSGITTTDTLRIKGALGTGVSPQLFDSYITHTSPGYLADFDTQWNGDNTGFVGWTGGYADDVSSAAAYPGAATGSGVLVQSSPMGAHSAAGSQGNAGLLQLNKVPWVSNTATSINNYSMKFEVYVASAWTGGEIWVSIGGWYGWSSYTARYAPWTAQTTGKYQPAGWYTATIPLNQFITKNEFWQSSYNTAGTPASTFADYPTTEVGFLIVNDLGTAVPANSMNLAIDNVRIVKGQ